MCYIYMKNIDMLDILFASIFTEQNIKGDNEKSLLNEQAFFDFFFLKKVVGDRGFEPLTLWSQTRCATKLR
jgi:hypothetical protein